MVVSQCCLVKSNYLPLTNRLIVATTTATLTRRVISATMIPVAINTFIVRVLQLNCNRYYFYANTSVAAATVVTANAFFGFLPYLSFSWQHDVLIMTACMGACCSGPGVCTSQQYSDHLPLACRAATHRSETRGTKLAFRIQVDTGDS